MDVILILICTLIALGTFLFWEFIAWMSHKYIMHGILWSWHKSHHTVHNHVLEMNDCFVILFSAPCAALFYYSTAYGFKPYLFSVAVGIALYGIFYFVFHEVIVHQRIKWRPASRPKYLQRIINAHYTHHSKHSKEDCEAFGFLYAPKKYAPKNFVFKAARQETQ